MSFSESDWYVLSAAVARCVREAKPCMMVRTETLFDIGAEGLIDSGDRAAYEQFEPAVRHTHTSMVDVQSLNALLTKVAKPVSDAPEAEDEE